MDLNFFENPVRFDRPVCLAFLHARFNGDVVANLLQGGLDVLKQHEDCKLFETMVFSVPGVCELPFALSVLLKRGVYDGIWLGGLVIQGKTAHDAMIMRHLEHGLSKQQMAHRVPLANAVLHVKSKQDAKARSDANQKVNQGAVAALALLEMVAFARMNLL